MAISDRLTKLITDITNAYTSIENKGGTIPSDKNTNNLSTAINSIEVIEEATAEGEDLTLTNTKAMPFKSIKVKGKTEQNSTTGKNLFNAKNPDGITGNSSISYDNKILTVSSNVTSTVPFATYIIDENLVEGDEIRLSAIVKNSNGRLRFQAYNGTSWVSVSSIVYTDGTTTDKRLYTVPQGVTGIKLLAYANDGIPSDNSSSSYENVIVTKNNENLGFEEYTGGIASPNSSYSQKIKNVEGKNKFDINDFENTSSSNMSMTITNNVLNLKATGTVGAQSARNYVKNVDETKTYTISCKAKKIIKETGIGSVLRIYCYGSNDDITYSSRIAESNIASSNLVQGQEYVLSCSVTGYKYYRFVFYNNGSTPVTLGEETEYWDIMFEERLCSNPIRSL